MIKRIFLFLLMFSFCSGSFLSAEVIRMGVYPIFKAYILAETFGPIAERIEEETGYRVTLSSAPDFSGFIRNCEEGMFDLVWINLAGYLRLSDSGRFRAVAAGYPGFRGAVVVRKDSGISKLEDLEGGKIIAVAKHSVAGYLFFRNLMHDLGYEAGRDYQVDFNENMEAIPFFVINGIYDAAVFNKDLYIHSPIYSKTENLLRVLEESILIPQFPFAVTEDMDPDTADRIERAICSLEMDCNPGNMILERLNLEGIIPVDDSYYDDFRVEYGKIRAYGSTKAGD